VLAQSQQEYLDSLKRNAKENSPPIDKASTSKAGLDVPSSVTSLKTRLEDDDEPEQTFKRLKSSSEPHDSDESKLSQKAACTSQPSTIECRNSDTSNSDQTNDTSNQP
jgi:hypothetical protein